MDHDKRGPKRYRIGDFARGVGVTADFLKHYQESGLLEAHRTPSGYRYYSFEQSARVIDYLRLRNYGVSIREMREYTNCDAERAMALLGERTREMRRTIERLQAIVDEEEALERWFEARRKRPVDWEIRDVEPYVFLRHTNDRAFLEDDRIRELLRDWCAWLPVTKSAMLVKPGPVEGASTVHWGFAVPERLLERYGIPCNDAVERLEFGRAFVFHFYELERSHDMMSVIEGRHPAYECLRELGFRVTGNGLLMNEMRLADETGKAYPGLGRFILPVDRA